jgi:hypothetical protein
VNDNIPSADDIRAANEKDKPNLEKWLETTLTHIGRFITRNQKQLANCEKVLFEYPVFRDFGRNNRIWKMHYPAVVEPLREKGYDVQFHESISGKRQMMIWVKGCFPDNTDIPKPPRMDRVDIGKKP